MHLHGSDWPGGKAFIEELTGIPANFIDEVHFKSTRADGHRLIITVHPIELTDHDAAGFMRAWAEDGQ